MAVGSNAGPGAAGAQEQEAKAETRAEEAETAESKAGTKAEQARAKAARDEARTARKEGGVFDKLKNFLGKERGAPAERTTGSGGANRGFALAVVVWGLIHWLLKNFYFGGEPQGFLFVSGFILMIMAGMALAGSLGKNYMSVLIPMILFMVWYSMGANWSPGFLVMYLVICIIIIIGFGAIAGREAVKMEFVGLLPVALFFVDIGLIAWLLETFDWQVTGWMATSILWTPWWVVFGAFTLPSGEGNTKYDLIKVAAMIWLVLSFAAPAVPGWGHETLPGFEELSASQARVIEQLPQGELLIVSRLKCMTEVQNYDECVAKRQEDSKIEAKCEKDELVQSRIRTMEECLAEEREKIEQAKIRVVGAEDRTIKEKTEAEFKVSDYFPMMTFHRADEEVITPYPVDFILKNPREQTGIEIEFNCYFQKGREGNVSGTTTPARITVNEKIASNTVVCQPDGQLNGTYTAVYEATMKNLNTWTRLPKIIVGQKNNEWMEEWADQLISAHCQRGNCVPLYPSEFATLKFAFGRTLDDPIIRSGDVYFLASTVEKGNVPGNLVKINHFELELEELGMYIEQQDCLEGFDLAVDGGEIIYLPACTFTELPPEYTELGEGYLYKEFIGKVNYDFRLKKEIRNVKVEVVS